MRGMRNDFNRVEKAAAAGFGFFSLFAFGIILFNLALLAAVAYGIYWLANSPVVLEALGYGS